MGGYFRALLRGGARAFPGDHVPQAALCRHRLGVLCLDLIFGVLFLLLGACLSTSFPRLLEFFEGCLSSLKGLGGHSLAYDFQRLDRILYLVGSARIGELFDALAVEEEIGMHFLRENLVDLCFWVLGLVKLSVRICPREFKNRTAYGLDIQSVNFLELL